MEAGARGRTSVETMPETLHTNEGACFWEQRQLASCCLGRRIGSPHPPLGSMEPQCFGRVRGVHETNEAFCCQKNGNNAIQSLRSSVRYTSKNEPCVTHGYRRLRNTGPSISSSSQRPPQLCSLVRCMGEKLSTFRPRACSCFVCFTRFALRRGAVGDDRPCSSGKTTSSRTSKRAAASSASKLSEL